MEVLKDKIDIKDEFFTVYLFFYYVICKKKWFFLDEYNIIHFSEIPMATEMHSPWPLECHFHEVYLRHWHTEQKPHGTQ